MGKIITFHDVHDAEWFEKIVCFLKKKYTMICAEQLLSYYYDKSPLPKDSCLITVDDGAATSYSVIYPILKKYHIPAIYFVSPLIAKGEKEINYWFQEMRDCNEGEIMDEAIKKFPYISNTYTAKTGDFISQLKIDDIWQLVHQYKSKYHRPYLKSLNMSQDEIREIDRDGLVMIGAHTMRHPYLASESSAQSKWEIEESIQQLAEMLGHEIVCFAYPNGRPFIDFDEREMTIVRDTTCKLAFSTYARDFSRKDNPFTIPRYSLTCGSIPFVKMKLMLGRRYKTVNELANKILRTFRWSGIR